MALGILYVLLQSSYVQTKLVKYFTQRIEATTGVKIQIGGVNFRPMSSLVLTDVLLRDFKNDTLLYCQDLRVKADSFDLIDRTFNIREVVLDHATFNLWVQDSTNDTNIELLLASLDKGGGDSSSEIRQGNGPGWLIGLQKISLRHSRFTYREEIFEPGRLWSELD